MAHGAHGLEVKTVFGQEYLLDDDGHMFMKRVMDSKKEKWELFANDKYKICGKYYETNDFAEISRYIDDKHEESKVSRPRDYINFDLEGMQEGDQYGHSNPHKGGGLELQANMTPQAQILNQGPMKSKEKYVREQSEAGHDTSEIMDMIYPENNPHRPEFYIDRVRVDGVTTTTYFPNSNDAYEKSSVTGKYEIVKPVEITEAELDYPGDGVDRAAAEDPIMEPAVEGPEIAGIDLMPDAVLEAINQYHAVNMEPAVTKDAIAEEADPTPAVTCAEIEDASLVPEGFEEAVANAASVTQERSAEMNMAM